MIFMILVLAKELIILGHSEKDAFKKIVKEFILTGVKNSNWQSHFVDVFGISVDDTIHFLAKYRQELRTSGWKIKRSVYASMRETGVSMFYTSIVLFFGFSVFMISSFGGTVALGGLVSATLLFAMLSNLLLLPSLLLSLERNVANKEEFKEPSLNIIDTDIEEEEEENENIKNGQ